MRASISGSRRWGRQPSGRRALVMETTLCGLNLVALIIVTIAAFLASLPGASAAPGPADQRLVSKADMKSGALLLKSTEEGRYVEAPRVGTDVDLTVSGPTARARVTQVFHNPTDAWVEAVYVYPLPEGAAVD